MASRKQPHSDHDPNPEGAATQRRDQVVVRTVTGATIKGFLESRLVSGNPAPIAPLPSILHIDELAGTVIDVDLASVKAVFFVKTHEGDQAYEEVKFFRERLPSNLWVQVWLKDGEAVEGRTENSVRLLTEPGFWLWPADTKSNNLLVYVPKTSIWEFHVMGFAAAKPRSEASDGSDLKSCVR